MPPIHIPWKYFKASVVDEQTLLLTVNTKSDLSLLACTAHSIPFEITTMNDILKGNRKVVLLVWELSKVSASFKLKCHFYHVSENTSPRENNIPLVVFIFASIPGRNSSS